MKGICFTEPLHHKVVKGEKTQTRRMINPEPIIKNDWFIDEIEGWKQAPFAVVLKLRNREQYEIMQFLNPKYKVGEIVYLKEPYILYQEEYQESKSSQSGIQYAYKFGNHLSIDEITGKSDSKWKNKLFMPESAARYFIEITAVRAERLQDISEDDCIKEGIDSFFNPLFSETRYKDYLNPNSECRSPQSSYASLINKINGKGTWEKNPFVWVYDFRLTTR